MKNTSIDEVEPLCVLYSRSDFDKQIRTDELIQAFSIGCFVVRYSFSKASNSSAVRGGISRGFNMVPSFSWQFTSFPKTLLDCT